MQLRSPAFAEGESIPDDYTAMSPPLEFVDVPPTAKSLAVVMEDPDVPRDRRPAGMFDHWVVWNLAPGLKGLAAGQDPPGTVGRSTIGSNAYVGPAPPYGEHRYSFYLYALDVVVDLPPDSTKADLYAAMSGHVVAVCALMGRYARPVV